MSGGKSREPNVFEAPHRACLVYTVCEVIGMGDLLGSVLLAFIVVGASVFGSRAKTYRGCVHDWGIAESSTGWDQKCRKCGAWRSGYGRTWA